MVSPLSPQKLLSVVARERCINRLKEIPAHVLYKDDGTKSLASVLVPLCVVQGEVCLLYTLRSSNLKNHKGQVSFPGGMKDNEESVIETALRETEEEIGVPSCDIDVWTQMSIFQGRNKSIHITPIVGEIKKFDINNLKCNVNEVEEVFTVPMAAFCDPKNLAHLKFRDYTLPIFLYGKHKIWGITGLITHCFLQCFLPSSLYSPDFLRKSYELDKSDNLSAAKL